MLAILQAEFWILQQYGIVMLAPELFLVLSTPVYTNPTKCSDVPAIQLHIGR
jgi:hypothetical protein